MQVLETKSESSGRHYERYDELGLEWYPESAGLLTGYIKFYRIKFRVLHFYDENYIQSSYIHSFTSVTAI